MIGSLAPRSVASVTLLQTLALLPPAIITGLASPPAFATLLSVALAVALAWEALFAVLRKRALGLHGVTTALIVMILVPADLAVWPLVITVSLGVVFGEQVFGGRGFGFVQPAPVALSLLMISFFNVQLPEPTLALAVATLPGAAVLLIFGLLSWRVILGVIVAAVLALALRGTAIDPASLAVALTFGAVFLICDPTSSAATPAGRLVYGALAGGLVVVFSPIEAITTEALVFAALLASIFAPLIDHLAVLLHSYRRRSRINV